MSIDAEVETKKKIFLEKHPALVEGGELVKDKESREINFKSKKPKTVEEAWREQTEAKAKYESGLNIVETNLLDFLSIEDPIIFNGKVIACVKRPTNAQIRAMVPHGLTKYKDKPQDIPEEDLKKYEKELTELMAILITKPKWTPQEWEEKSNPWFIRLFWEHIGNISQMAQVQIEGF